MYMGVVKKKEQEKRHSIAGIKPVTTGIGRLVSYPLGHQGSWVFHEHYNFVNRVNYDMQIKHSACKGLKGIF